MKPLYFRFDKPKPPFERVTCVYLGVRESGGGRSEARFMVEDGLDLGIAIDLDGLREWVIEATRDQHKACLDAGRGRFTTLVDVQVACLRLSIPNTHTHDGFSERKEGAA